MRSILYLYFDDARAQMPGSLITMTLLVMARLVILMAWVSRVWVAMNFRLLMAMMVVWASSAMLFWLAIPMMARLATPLMAAWVSSVMGCHSKSQGGEQHKDCNL